MASPSRLQYGQYYHIYNRGNNRENLFYEECNYRHFLKLYTRYIEPVAYTYAYCLLRNHFHILVYIKTEEEQEQTFRVSDTLKVFKVSSPSQKFSNLFNAYAKAINKAHQRTGSLFQHPFGRILITSDAHFVHLIAYIHRNPQKHGFVDDFRDWTYSSYHTILSQKPTRLKRDDVLDWFDNAATFQASHQQAVNKALIAPLISVDFN